VRIGAAVTMMPMRSAVAMRGRLRAASRRLLLQPLAAEIEPSWTPQIKPSFLIRARLSSDAL